MSILRSMLFVTVLSSSIVVAACERDADPQDFAAMELTRSALQASPTNAHADDDRAADLGRALFFDKGMSSDGNVGCVSCHDPEHGFSDPRARSEGVGGQRGDRHSMPITAVALQTFFFWDGRADSAWSQPLQALENPKEMDFTRVEIAHRVSTTYRAQYEEIFGPVPDLSAAPARARPGDDAWSAMPEALRHDVERVFANVGKAIEAYERKLLCENTRFDRWVRGEIELSNAEQNGARVFQRQNCARCHSGPAFSDGKFHDIGIPSADRGRLLGTPLLMSDVFNGDGAYSDDHVAGASKLAAIPRESAGAREGAFRTASLRGVGQRTFFGHASHEETLRSFILDIYRGRGGRGGRGGNGGGRTATVGTIDPQLNGVNVDGDDVDDLVAFLRTLDCPTPPASLLDPHSRAR